jgi:hypothetical protein
VHRYRKCDWKILGVILAVIEVQVSVLRSVARRRLVETENVCKSEMALYSLY